MTEKEAKRGQLRSQARANERHVTKPPEDLLLSDLKAVIADRKAVIIVGSGVSVLSTNGAPVASWRGLLENGVERCEAVAHPLPSGWSDRLREQIRQGDLEDLLSAAENVARRLQRASEYRRWLRETVGELRAEKREALEALAELGAPLVTTNYDSLLEEVTGWDPVTWRDGALAERVLKGQDKGVLHLHGHWRNPDSVVLGISSYEAVLASAFAQAVQHTLRFQHNLLFVGFGRGLADPNFAALLRWAREVFADSEDRHFRLARATEVDAVRQEHPPEEHVQVLAYGAEYSDLPPFLRSLFPSATLPVLQESSVPKTTNIPTPGETTQESRTKTKPPVRIVSKDHRGDYEDIGKAIAEAQSGDQILVHPGVYTEALVIDKPLQILGVGARPDIVVETSGQHTVQFRATMGGVANLTLRQQGGGDWYCVDIAQGRLSLEDCDISSRSLACVAIYGEANPTLDRNVIHDGAQVGVLVYNNGQGTLEGNDIFGNVRAGVEIVSGGNPVLRANTIREGQTSGIYVHDGGHGLIEDNEIRRNSEAGVAITTEARPLLRRNRIYQGRQAGVTVHLNGQGMLEENDIFGNTLAGVEVASGGNPVLRGNRIREGQTSGVYVHDRGEGIFEDNDIANNLGAGVVIAGKASEPILRRNRIHESKEGGVVVEDHAGGLLERNDLYSNARWGVEIKDEATPTLRGNRIHDHDGAGGVYIHEGASGTLEDNDIVGNSHMGIEIGYGANPVIIWNRINNNRYEGIKVSDGGAGRIENNDLQGNKEGPLKLDPRHSLLLKLRNNKPLGESS